MDWRPVSIVEVDVETLSSDLSVRLDDGERIWIEVTKQGQVVGVVDGRTEDGAVSVGTLKKIEAEFSNVEISFPVRVPDDQLAKASVVVPTLCRNPAELVRLVESLLALDYPEFDVIIVDNRQGERLGPLPAFPGGAKVRTIAEPIRGVSAARNHGVEVATGDIVAFTDDDATVDAGWLRAFGSRFALDDDVDGIGGLVLPTELKSAPQLWFEEFYGGFSPSFRAEKMSTELLKGVDGMFPYAVGRFGAGCNMAYRKDALLRVGGFDLNLGGGKPSRGGEDVALAIELVVTGGTFAYEPAAMVRHTHRRTEDEFFKQVFSYGIGLTAMYSAMIARDPRHLGAIVRRFPLGFRHLIRSREDRSPSTTPSYPRKALAYQMVGMAYGPVAYLRSVVVTRRLAKNRVAPLQS